MTKLMDEVVPSMSQMIDFAARIFSSKVTAAIFFSPFVCMCVCALRAKTHWSGRKTLGTEGKIDNSTPARGGRLFSAGSVDGDRVIGSEARTGSGQTFFFFFSIHSHRTRKKNRVCFAQAGLAFTLLLFFPPWLREKMERERVRGEDV